MRFLYLYVAFVFCGCRNEQPIQPLVHTPVLQTDVYETAVLAFPIEVYNPNSVAVHVRVVGASCSCSRTSGTREQNIIKPFSKLSIPIAVSAENLVTSHESVQQYRDKLTLIAPNPINGRRSSSELRIDATIRPLVAGVERILILPTTGHNEQPQTSSFTIPLAVNAFACSIASRADDLPFDVDCEIMNGRILTLTVNRPRPVVEESAFFTLNVLIQHEKGESQLPLAIFDQVQPKLQLSSRLVTRFQDSRSGEAFLHPSEISIQHPVGTELTFHGGLAPHCQLEPLVEREGRSYSRIVLLKSVEKEQQEAELSITCLSENRTVAATSVVFRPISY